ARMMLGDTGIATSALGFGCAHLFREPSRSARARLIDRALDAGIVHFDVAPMYGLGAAEAELGRLLRGRRDGVVVATKFGIEPTRRARALAPLQGVLARLGARRGRADARAGAVGSALYRSGLYAAADARASLERSLRALRTDHVDLLLVHDPPPGVTVGGELRDALEHLQADGLVRAWGVAGEMALAAGGDDAPRVLQLPGDLFSRPAALRRPAILYGVVSRALPPLARHLQAEDVRRRWSDALGADAGRDAVIGTLLLRDALDAATGPVLVGTTQPARIDAAAAAAASPAGDDLDAFRALVAEVPR
ncbi:MAG TPA: aldo/keto reductase, partial [Gaiellaceae bacterium]|nr:aldo/keto reductase [Gaiellaceae bacterium]